MSYIQVQIGGKLRGLKFNQLSIEVFSKHFRYEDSSEGVKHTEDEMALTSLIACVYAGLVANCYAKREEPDFNFENVCDWVEAELIQAKNTDVVKAINDCFESSTAYIFSMNEMAARQEEITGKKKQEPTLTESG